MNPEVKSKALLIVAVILMAVFFSMAAYIFSGHPSGWLLLIAVIALIVAFAALLAFDKHAADSQCNRRD